MLRRNRTRKVHQQPAVRRKTCFEPSERSGCRAGEHLSRTIEFGTMAWALEAPVGFAHRASEVGADSRNGTNSLSIANDHKIQGRNERARVRRVISCPPQPCLAALSARSRDCQPKASKKRENPRGCSGADCKSSQKSPALHDDCMIG